jgi:hypothetical protein
LYSECQLCFNAYIVGIKNSTFTESCLPKILWKLSRYEAGWGQNAVKAKVELSRAESQQRGKELRAIEERREVSECSTTRWLPFLSLNR